MLEQENQIKIQEVETDDKKKIQDVEGALLRITDDKVYFQAYFISNKCTKVTNSGLYK